MDTQPTFGLTELLTHLIGAVANAVSERDGETQHQRLARTLAAAHTIMAFQPRDAIEAMLAGHCVMFHELIVDSVHVTLRGEEPATRRATRGGIVAMDRAFSNSLARLERYRKRQAKISEEARAETEIGDRVQRQEPTSGVAAGAAGRQASSAPETVSTVLQYPSPGTIATRHAGDPAPDAAGSPDERDGTARPLQATDGPGNGVNGPRHSSEDPVYAAANGARPPRPGGDPRVGGNRHFRRHGTP
jgi:hypothetical protein